MSSDSRPTAPSLHVEYWRGIHLQDSVLWMDAPRKVDLTFLSHAHLGTPAGHGKVLATDATFRLGAGLAGGTKALVSPFNRRFALGELDLELRPAGHVLGSAQLLVSRAGQRLVYTGHFRLESGRTTERAEAHPCDVLVLNTGATPVGLKLPPRKQQEEALIEWVQSVIQAGDRPVLQTAPLGLAQELAALLGDHGLRMRVHRSIYQHCKTYHALGVRLPGVRSFRGTPSRGEVTIFPHRTRRSKAIEHLDRARVAVVGARTAAPSSPAGQRKERFALSTSADHPAIVDYARASGAQRIHVVGLHAVDMAADLRGRGLAAWPLRPPEQLALFGSAQDP